MSAIHERIENITGGEMIAVAVRWDWLNKEYYPFHLSHLNYNYGKKLAPLPVRELAATLSVAPDPASFTFTLNGENRPTLSCVLLLQLRSAQDTTLSFREWKLSYSNIEMELAVDPSLRNEIRLAATTVTQPIVSPVQPTPSQQAINLPQGYNGDLDRYLADEKSILMLGWKGLLQAFIDQLPFPAVRESLRSFCLGDQSQFFYDAEYAVIATRMQNLAAPGCPVGGSSAIQLSVNLADDLKPLPDDASSETSPHAVQPLVVTFDPVSKGQAPVAISAPDLVLYLPKDITLLQWAARSLSPAVGASDSGIALFVRWFYSATAQLKSIDVTLKPGAATFQLTTAWSIFGNAGANLKVGCVENGIVNVSAFVDPLGPLVVDISPSIKKECVFLTTNLTSSGNTQIEFSGLGFPLDIVWNWLANSFAKKLISQTIANAVDTFRIPLLDLKNNPDQLVIQDFGIDLLPRSALLSFRLSPWTTKPSSR